MGEIDWGALNGRSICLRDHLSPGAFGEEHLSKEHVVWEHVIITPLFYGLLSLLLLLPFSSSFAALCSKLAQFFRLSNEAQIFVSLSACSFAPHFSHWLGLCSTHRFDFF